MTTKSNRRRLTGYSNLAIPPGESIAEEAECRGISPERMADLCQISPATLQRIYAGRQEITPALAESIAQAFPGTQASVWLNLEQLYQETLAYNNQTRPS